MPLFGNTVSKHTPSFEAKTTRGQIAKETHSYIGMFFKCLFSKDI